jgi:hypothetical protein
MSLLVATEVLAISWLAPSGGAAWAQDGEFTSEFRLEDCTFAEKGGHFGRSRSESNPYFILRPRYQLLLEGEEEGEAIRVLITVLNETEKVRVPGLGRVETRVVEEREWVDEELVEVSRNFFARCSETNDVFYFGEEVDICEEGLEPVRDGFQCEGGEPSHEGAWRAGVDGARPGLIMSGRFLLGSRYFQEIAAGVALDRAEHTEMGLEVTTDAGTFHDCVRVVETTPLEPGSESEKTYCPGVGLVTDDPVELIDFGFHVVDLDD